MRGGFAPNDESESIDTPETAPSVRVSGAARLGGQAVFSNIALVAEAGRWTAVLGRSGSGKTTLLKAIAGLLDAEAFDGVVAASDGAALSGRVAWMAQSDLLAPWARAIDSVSLGQRLRGETPSPKRAADALSAVGLGDRLHARPDALSGGQRQRVALARTLLEDRPVVLLDEPFSALDAATRAELHELAWERLAGRTVVLVTHDPLEAARLAHAAWILPRSGEAGLIAAPLAGAPLRDPDAETTLRAAAEIARLLRAAP